MMELNLTESRVFSHMGYMSDEGLEPSTFLL